jgi:hypothetical protein
MSSWLFKFSPCVKFCPDVPSFELSVRPDISCFEYEKFKLSFVSGL